MKAPLSARHDPTKITQKSVAKETNTMIDNGVDVKADVDAINAGKASKVGDTYIVNGRSYGYHPDTGRLYPISGDGFTVLGRGEFKALGVYNTFGDTPRANQILDNMGIEEAKRQKALAVWKKNH